MKKLRFLLIAVWGTVMGMPAALADVFVLSGNADIPKFCLIGSPDSAIVDTSKKTCYWCADGGDRAGFCTSQYAGCRDGSDLVVPNGSILTDSENGTKWKCTVDGWQNNVEPVTCYSGYGCKDGCYWDAGPYTCLECPSPSFVTAAVAGPMTEKEGERSDITDCFIMPGRGFLDGTGMFELTGRCYYTL